MTSFQPRRSITFTGILLGFTAGFSDCLTFTIADELFSAHVTGNFVVLAYDLVSGADQSAWHKLASFPVFIFGVAAAGLINSRYRDSTILLLLEGVMLMVAGLFFTLSEYTIPQLSKADSLFKMLIVFAMAFQNTFGRISAKATFAPTTVMTGNVTQVTLDIATGLAHGSYSIETAKSIQSVLKIIGAFLCGCVCGGLLGWCIGLEVILLPGLLMTWAFLSKRG